MVGRKQERLLRKHAPETGAWTIAAERDLSQLYTPLRLGEAGVNALDLAGSDDVRTAPAMRRPGTMRRQTKNAGDRWRATLPTAGAERRRRRRR